MIQRSSCIDRAASARVRSQSMKSPCYQARGENPVRLASPGVASAFDALDREGPWLVLGRGQPE